MNTLFIPTEDDFRRWIKEAVTESLANATLKNPADEKDSQLLSRKEIAAFLGISLVTLTDWMRRGLPFHKVNGRVYFQRSAVLEYVKSHGQRRTGI